MVFGRFPAGFRQVSGRVPAGFRKSIIVGPHGTKELDDIGGDPGLVLGENGPKTIDQCILDFYHENLKCQLPWSKYGIRKTPI